MMSRQLMRRRPSAESAWQRRILFGRRYFLFDKRHKTPIYLIQGQVRSTQLFFPAEHKSLLMRILPG